MRAPSSLLISFIAAFLLFAFAMKKKSYTYIDGNNNTYTITQLHVDYKPVSKENSSSGTYSGGDPKKIGISKEQFEKLLSLMNGVKSDKPNQLPQRNMGCGTLYMKGEGKPVYIGMNAKSKADLEGELKLILFGI
jgi:hypothetical protein